MTEYQKTDFSQILSNIEVKNNNFVSIFNEFNSLVPDYKFTFTPTKSQFQNGNIMEENIKSDEENEKYPNYKAIELLKNGNDNDLVLNSNMLIITNSSSKSKKRNQYNEEKLNNFSEFSIEENLNEDNYAIKFQNFVILYREKYKYNIMELIRELINKKSNKNKRRIEIMNINYQNKNIINDNIKNIHINNFNMPNENLPDDDNINNEEQNNFKFGIQISPGKDFNKYKKTDVSKIMLKNDILNNDKLEQTIEFINYKQDPGFYNENIDNYNSSNVRLNLDSGYKKNLENICYTIREEDNESYDSISLHKSIKSSAKAKSNILENKSKSIKEVQDLNINNNLLNTFSKEKSNLNNDKNNNIIEEINKEEEDDKNDNININNSKKENKIIIIDLNLKEKNKNVKNNIMNYETNKIINEKSNNNYNINNYDKGENKGPESFKDKDNKDVNSNHFDKKDKIKELNQYDKNYNNEKGQNDLKFQEKELKNHNINRLDAFKKIINNIFLASLPFICIFIYFNRSSKKS